MTFLRKDPFFSTFDKRCIMFLEICECQVHVSDGKKFISILENMVTEHRSHKFKKIKPCC